MVNRQPKVLKLTNYINELARVDRLIEDSILTRIVDLTELSRLPQTAVNEVRQNLSE